jgi:hypothetical protein
MLKSDLYRDYAQQAFASAAQASRTEQADLFEIAETWLELAKSIERVNLTDRICH